MHLNGENMKMTIGKNFLTIGKSTEHVGENNDENIFDTVINM